MKYDELLSFFDRHDQERLDELNVKDIRKAIDPKDLPHRDYEPLLKAVQWEGVNKNICRWLVNNNKNGWMTYVRFLDWDTQIKDTRYTAKQTADLIMWSSDIQIHCLCPAYKFWGGNYICTQLGIAIIPENRFPHIRNPQLKSLGCKHIRKLWRVINFQTGYLAQAIKQQRDSLGIKYQKY